MIYRMGYRIRSVQILHIVQISEKVIVVEVQVLYSIFTLSIHQIQQTHQRQLSVQDFKASFVGGEHFDMSTS